jgi:cytochrome c biogenesis protein
MLAASNNLIEGPQSQPGGVCWLASTRLTLVAIGLLVAAVTWLYNSNLPPTWLLSAPLTLLAVNLLAAVACTPTFRRNVPLLVFHLALLAVLLLVAWGRMTYLDGWAEVSEGTDFDGQLGGFEAGPWHDLDDLSAARFTNLGFDIAYLPGPRRDRTQNRVAWRDVDGARREAVIGDHDPLVLNGYRFYTSFNKGFAPTFNWTHPSLNKGVTGTIHLPSYPANEYGQALEWALPGTEKSLWIMLEFDEEILLSDRPSQFRPPENHLLVVRDGSRRLELKTGETLQIAGGELAYLGLRQWMGYTIYRDDTRPWILASCLLAVLALGWHFASKYRMRSWQVDEPPAAQGDSTIGMPAGDAP